MSDQQVVNELDAVFDSSFPQHTLSLITTCVNYTDYLEDTLRYNYLLFTSIYVITTPSDKTTIELCQKYKNIHCITTNLFYEHRAVFNKGKAINHLLRRIPKIGWIVIGDSDCVFPRQIVIDIKSLDINNIYTYPRHIANNKKHLENIMDNKDNPKFLPNRNAKKILGYCQLFSLESRKIRNIEYPTYIKDASKSDTIFSSNWPPENRVVLKDNYIIHLGEIGVNWKGRSTHPWT